MTDRPDRSDQPSPDLPADPAQFDGPGLTSAPPPTDHAPSPAPDPTTDHGRPYLPQPGTTLQPGADAPSAADFPPHRPDTAGRPTAPLIDNPLTSTLRGWLVVHRGWLPGHSRALVEDVLAAVQAHHDATLIANHTYRALRRDEVSVERLAAWLANHGQHEAVLMANGDPVDAAISLLGEVLDMPLRLLFAEPTPEHRISVEVLRLVREYGLQEREDGGSTREAPSPAAAALLDQIRALVEQRPAPTPED